MSTIIFDPESADKFRAHLQRFNHDLQEDFGSMLAHWESLGDIWRDDYYERFGEALTEVAQGVKRYLDMTESHDRYLAEVIEAGEQFKRARLR